MRAPRRWPCRHACAPASRPGMHGRPDPLEVPVGLLGPRAARHQCQQTTCPAAWARWRQRGPRRRRWRASQKVQQCDAGEPPGERHRLASGAGPGSGKAGGRGSHLGLAADGLGAAGQPGRLPGDRARATAGGLEGSGGGHSEAECALVLGVGRSAGGRWGRAGGVLACGRSPLGPRATEWAARNCLWRENLQKQNLQVQRGGASPAVPPPPHPPLVRGGAAGWAGWAAPPNAQRAAAPSQNYCKPPATSPRNNAPPQSTTASTTPFCTKFTADTATATPATHCDHTNKTCFVRLGRARCACPPAARCGAPALHTSRAGSCAGRPATRLGSPGGKPFHMCTNEQHLSCVPKRSCVMYHRCQVPGRLRLPFVCRAAGYATVAAERVLRLSASPFECLGACLVSFCVNCQLRV